MPPAIPALAAIGGGSAMAGAAGLATAAGGLYSASQDRKANRANQRTAAAERAESLQFIQDREKQAQNFLSGAYPEMQSLIGQGYQGAYNVQQGAIPQQLSAIRQGGQDAQRFLMGSLPYYQAALMGTPFDMNQVVQNTRPASVGVDMSMFNQQLPQFGQPVQFNPLAGR